MALPGDPALNLVIKQSAQPLSQVAVWASADWLWQCGRNHVTSCVILISHIILCKFNDKITWNIYKKYINFIYPCILNTGKTDSSLKNGKTGFYSFKPNGVYHSCMYIHTHCLMWCFCSQSSVLSDSSFTVLDSHESIKLSCKVICLNQCREPLWCSLLLPIYSILLGNMNTNWGKHFCVT